MKLARNILFPYMVCIMIFLSFTSHSNAQSSRIYLAGYMGLSDIPDSSISGSSVDGDVIYDNNMSFAGALGLRLNYNLRLEAELSYSKNDLARVTSGNNSFNAGGEMGRLSAMLIGYYDFDVPWKVRPFVSAGFGFHKYDADIEGDGFTNESGDDFTFGWTMGGGVKYRLNDDAAITGGYRYIGSSDLEIGNYDLEYSNHELRVGLEFDLH